MRSPPPTSEAAAMSGDPSSSSSPSRGSSPIPQPSGSTELLRCPLCQLLLCEPVTVSCGHSFCRACLGGAVPPRCPVCHRRLRLLGVRAARSNVVLCGLLEKCEEGESHPPGLRGHGRHHLAHGDTRDVLGMAQKGTEMADEEEPAAPCDAPRLAELLSASDLECSLCVRLFLEPVTTPCGHTFCRECLERCLDHRPSCPLCKQSLREYLKAGSYSPTLLLQDIMVAAFPAQLAERRELHRAEMAELSNLTTNIPIFVCTMAFPGVACPLHIFEPRYRLMMRRCQESGTRRFGMCMYDNGKSFADYGCMLEIRCLELLADGRSLVDTIGGRRFRVLRRGHRDGYDTADIEYLEDKKVAGEELKELQSLHESTYQLAQRLWEHEDVTSRHLSLQHRPLPEKEENIQASADGPTWCWWLLSVLPLEPSFQLRLFSSTSLGARLAQLQRVLLALLQPPASQPEHSPQGLV